MAAASEQPTKGSPASARKRPGRALKDRPHAISFKDAVNLTKDSFKDECDFNRVIAQYAKTGHINHTARGKPQFAEAPDQNFFESACIAAETASADEQGLLDPTPAETAEIAPEGSQDESVTVSDPETDENPLPEGATPDEVGTA